MTDIASPNKGYVTKAPFQQVMPIEIEKTIKKNKKIIINKNIL